MESKNKKTVAKIEKKEDVEMTKEVKPNEMVSDVKDIRTNYGKCAIIIKDNIIFRTSTQTSEKAPLSVKDLYLPNYGKMRKFVVLEDGVYEIFTKAEQKGTEFAQYELGDKVSIDPSNLDFELDNVWNKVKAIAKAEEKATE